MSPKTETTEETQPEVVNLIDSQAELIEADLVRTSRSYVGTLHAEEVELFQAAALDVEARNIHSNSAVVGVGQASSISAKDSLILASRAEKLEISNSLAGGIYAESTLLGEGSQTGILVTGKASGEQIRSVVLIARQVDGNVETMLNTRQVALASVLTGLACGFVIMLGQILFRKKK